MSTRLPSLYAGTGVFGRCKISSFHNKPGIPFHSSISSIPSMNDLIIIGRKEVASMNYLKDSLKYIKKQNNITKFQHHRVKQKQTITSKDIEMFLASEPSYNEDDTEIDYENIDERQDAQEQRMIEDETDSDAGHHSFEDEDSDPEFSDFIALTDSDFNIGDMIEQNETDTNLLENNRENINNSQIPSSQNKNDNTDQPNHVLNSFDLLQQTSLEDESNIHQINDALLFVSSMLSNTSVDTSSVSVSPSVSVQSYDSNLSLGT